MKLLRLEGDDFRMALAGIFAHEVSTTPPKALPEGGTSLLDRLESWIARARALCEQSAQHPEPPVLARHLAAELAAELPVAELLDAARDISSPALIHMLDVLSQGAKLMDGRPVALRTEPLDEATAASLAPLLEAAQLRAALGKLTAVSV